VVDQDKARRLKDEGWSVRAIAEEMGLSARAHLLSAELDRSSF
jgi:hypothetical protein